MPSESADEAADATLLEVLQAGLLTFQDGAHPTQSGSFKLFAAVQRITVLHQTHIVFGNAEEVEEGKTKSIGLLQHPS